MIEYERRAVTNRTLKQSRQGALQLDDDMGAIVQSQGQQQQVNPKGGQGDRKPNKGVCIDKAKTGTCTRKDCPSDHSDEAIRAFKDKEAGRKAAKGKGKGKQGKGDRSKGKGKDGYSLKARIASSL